LSSSLAIRRPLFVSRYWPGRTSTIIRALDDPPSGLEELRGVLLREHVWRQHEGL
jgi:hypothetical protein